MASDRSSEQVTPRPGVGWRLTLSAVVLGTTSLVTQVVLLREFLSVFYGNELVIGVLLANWMILTGLGSYLGRALKVSSGEQAFLVPLLALLAIVPFVTVFFLRLLRNVVFPVGTMVGFGPMMGSSFVLLIPYCLLSGAAFTFLASLASSDDRSRIGDVYAREALGSAGGGVVFSLLLISYLNTFQAFTGLMALDLAAALAVAPPRSSARSALWVVAIVCLVPAIAIDTDTLTRRFLFPGQEVLFTGDSPYGSLTVTRQADQENFYENGSLLSSTNDVESSEESVHFAMVQHPSPKTVLMVSGAINGAPNEVLKYGVGRLDYVEINPHLIELAKRYTSALNDDRINVINEDARLFIRETKGLYDVVLLNVPEPVTVQANRYYTLEFFEGLKGKMNAGGVLSLGLLPATDYQSEDARRINSTMMNTLRSLFKNVLIVPGMKTYFLASDAALDVGIGRLVERRGITNTYVNQYYLDDQDLARRSDLIQGSLMSEGAINRDFEPVSYYRQVVHWLSYFRANLWMIAVLVAIILSVVATQFNAISAGVFTGGFAASSIEVLLLISFQIFYGHVYQLLGIIVTLFMAGLAAGSYFRRWVFPRANVQSYVWLQLGIAAYCFLLPLALLSLRSVQDIPALVHGAFFFLTFIIAVLIGLEFSVAAMLRPGRVRNVASELYGVDLIGSALGALLVAAFLIPVLGVLNVSLVAGSLSFLTALVTLAGRKRVAASVT
jgi:spermidine synthase